MDYYMNTALILSGKELYELIKLRGDGASVQLQNFIKEICFCAEESVDLVLSLQEKRLARWDGTTLTLEPFLKLLIDEACETTSVYEPVEGAYALECVNMHLLLTRYEWADDIWRIAPHKDKASLLSSLE